MRLHRTLPVLALSVFSTSAFAICGDGVIDADEECDDGGLDTGDGCDEFCATELGYECTDATFTLDFSHEWGTSTAPSWTLSADGRTVEEHTNSRPAAYISTLPATGVEVEFDMRVNTSSDDDFIGWLIWPDADDTEEFILFDWKQADQGTATRGTVMSWVDIDGITDESDFWDHARGVSIVTRGLTRGLTGWADLTTYRVRMHYTTTRIQVWINDELEFDETGMFPTGTFGFYAYSQPSAWFSLVSPEGGSVCAELDTDGDLITDPDEFELGTDPESDDSDTDGIGDFDEIYTTGTDPTDSDSDGDGILDGDELIIPGMDPLNPDVDGDGVLSMTDAALLLSEWGALCDDCPADLDGDGEIGVTDLEMLLDRLE